MNQPKTFADTLPKLDARAVSLELEAVRVARRKSLEQRLILGGKSIADVRRILKLHERTRKNNFSLHLLHTTWKAMWSRCTNPKDDAFPRYGGRGIGVCDQWKDFIQFVVDAGVRPKGKTLDRWPDRNGNYEPSNVRWATPREQIYNSSGPIMLEFNGKTQCVSDWANEMGIGLTTLFWRLNRKWPLDQALRPEGKPPRTHCLAGHEYTPESSYFNPQGERRCRICLKLKMREYRKTPQYREWLNRRMHA